MKKREIFLVEDTPNVLQTFGVSVHDNEIQSYTVDIRNETLEMVTKCFNNEFVMITFRGMQAHQFEDVTYQNVIFEIEELSINYFVSNKTLLDKLFSRTFPEFAEDVGKLKEHLMRSKIKVFKISSSIGLCGFVLAREILIKTMSSA